MSGFHFRHALSLMLLMAAASACGSATDPDAASDPDPPVEASSTLEPITSEGVAGVVREVIGADRIVSYSAAGESDSVGVLVRLAGRQVLVVNVQTEGDVPVSSCDDITRTAMGPGDCVVDDDGTIVASGASGPFSDDNARGSTALAQAVNPQSGRVVYALYETYSRTAVLDPATLATIVSNPALAAMTDPATNEAGADIEVTRQTPE